MVVYWVISKSKYLRIVFLSKSHHIITSPFCVKHLPTRCNHFFRLPIIPRMILIIHAHGQMQQHTWPEDMVLMQESRLNVWGRCRVEVLGSEPALINVLKLPCYQGKHSCSQVNKVNITVQSDTVALLCVHTITAAQNCALAHHLGAPPRAGQHKHPATK